MNSLVGIRGEKNEGLPFQGRYVPEGEVKKSEGGSGPTYWLVSRQQNR
jgi:hypothetical protein